MRKIDEIPNNKQVYEAVDGLDLETLQSLTAQANRYQEYLDKSLRGVISRSWILVGWLVTLTSSLVAVLVSQLWDSFPEVNVIIVTSYGLAASLGIILYMVIKNFLFVSWFGPGEQPAVILRKETMELTDDCTKKEKHRRILAYNLIESQRLIDYNRGVLESIVKPYRTAVIATLVSIIVGVALVFVLAIV